MVNIKKRPFLHRCIRPIVGVLLFSFLFVVILSPSHAAGRQLDRGARWTVDFDFTAGVVDAKLIIETGFIDADGELIEITTHEPILLECPEHNGQLDFQEDGAVFDGDVYLSCQLPSIADAVYHFTRGELVLKSECECKNPWIEGDIWVDPSGIITTPNETQAGRTIFYHPDIDLRTAVANTHDQASFHLQVDNADFWSGFFPLMEEISPFRAWIKRSAGLNYLPGFVFDGQNLPAYGSTNNSLKISTGAAIIYVGHQPNGANFMGVMRNLKVDPPCIVGNI